MDTDQERRAKAIDELRKLNFHANVPSPQEFHKHISTFLDGLGPGKGLIGRPEEYMDLDETNPTDTLAQKEGDGNETGATDLGPVPNDAIVTGNATDDGNVVGSPAGNSAKTSPTDTLAQEEGGGNETGAAHLGPVPNDAIATGNAGDSAKTTGISKDRDGDIVMQPADPDSESVEIGRAHV